MNLHYLSLKRTTTKTRFGARCYDFVAFVVVDNVYRLHMYVLYCPIKISVLHGSRFFFIFFLPFVCFDLSSGQTEIFRSDAKDQRPPEEAAVKGGRLSGGAFSLRSLIHTDPAKLVQG